MVSPASIRPLPLVSTGVPACLVKVLSTTPGAGTVVPLVPEMTAPPAGLVATAVAVLVIAAASRSAWLIVEVPVQVVLAPGARVVTGQRASGTFASRTPTPLRVTAPVLVTAKE